MADAAAGELPLKVAKPKKRAAPKMTEAAVLELLRRRYTRAGNGGSGEYAVLLQVRNSAGFNSTRTFDAVVMSLWPSRGLRLHAFEVKCNRGDWLRELKQPAKAEAAAKLVDQFSVVVSDPAIVAEGELPPTWGLLVVKGAKLVCAKDAPLLPGARPEAPVRRDFVVSMLRAGGAVPTADPEVVRLARDEGAREARAAAQVQIDDLNAQLRKVMDDVRAFERAAGVRLRSWYGERQPADVGRQLRAVLESDSVVARTHDTLARAHQQLIGAADQLKSLMEPDG